MLNDAKPVELSNCSKRGFKDRFGNRVTLSNRRVKVERTHACLGIVRGALHVVSHVLLGTGLGERDHFDDLVCLTVAAIDLNAKCIESGWLNLVLLFCEPVFQLNHSLWAK